jgi:DNA-binding SARP family transcriptional activator
VDRALAGLLGGAVALVAGAGYGKSTLLTQLVARCGRRVAWCSCDERLETPELLFAHVAAGLGDGIAGFGARLSLAGSPPDQVAALTNEVVETVADEIVLVVDDAHELPPPTAEALGVMMSAMPPSVALAIATRGPLPFPRRSFGTRRLVVLGEDDLALGDAEAVELLRAIGADIAGDDARRIVEQSEGWVTGVILGAQSPARPGPRRGGEAPEVFGYFADELLDRQTPDVRDFLLHTGVVDRFCPALAAAITRNDEAPAIIRRLVDAHLFCVPLPTGGGPTWFRYHNLLQTYLRDRLAALDPAAVAESHRRAGEWFLGAEEPAEAISHLIAAGDLDAAAVALERVAEEMVRGPQAASVGRWLRALPREELEQRPALALAYASVLSVEQRYEEAFAAMTTTVDLFLARGDADRASLVLCRLIRFRGAVGLGLLHGVDAVAEVVHRLDPSGRLVPLAKILLAGGYGWICRFEDAEREIDEALALPGARGTAIPRIYASVVRAHLIERIRGRAAEVPETLGVAIEALLDDPEGDELDFAVHASAFRAFALSYLGRHEEALAETRRHRAIAARTGELAGAEQSRRWIAFTAMAELERWEELSEELERAGDSSGPFHGSAMSYYVHAFRAHHHAHRGERARVLAEIGVCRDMMQAHLGGPDFTAMSDLSRAALRAGMAAEATALAQEALAIARQSAAGWGTARAALLVAAADSGTEAGAAALAEALEITNRLGLEDLWVWKERGLVPDLLARAMTERLGPPGTAERLAAACGGEVLERLLARGEGDVRRGARRARTRLAAGGRLPLRIVGFGEFMVLRGGQPVPRASYERDRARMLLAALAAAGAPVPRDRIFEWLWPNLSPPRAARALYTTLHALRRAIEPDRTGPAAGSVVALEGETCALHLGEGDSFDVREFFFLSESNGGEGDPVRLERLIAADRLVQGEVFPEWTYADWCSELQAKVEHRHHRVLQELAETQARSGLPSDAAQSYRRLVAIEPEREEWHRGLMTTFFEGGEAALALRQYHACRAVLRRELGIEPSPLTRQLYTEILATC